MALNREQQLERKVMVAGDETRIIRISELAEMYVKRRMTLREITAETGLTHSDVSRWLDAAGVEKRQMWP